MSRAEELQSLYVQCLMNGRMPARYAQLLDEVEFANGAPDLLPSDREILDVLTETFDARPDEMIERLICIDFVALHNSLNQGN